MDATSPPPPARFGGEEWMPLYSRFYVRAAASLVEQSGRTGNGADDLVLPILYLQRHAVELIIKDAILACFHLDEARFVAGKGERRVKPPAFDHDLPSLVSRLRGALEA